MTQTILIINFGSQMTRLIARRVRHFPVIPAQAGIQEGLRFSMFWPDDMTGPFHF